MKPIRKQTVAAALAGLLVLAAAGCGGDKTADGGKGAAPKDTLRVGVAGFAAALERTTRNVIAVMTPATAGMIALAGPVKNRAKNKY